MILMVGGCPLRRQVQRQCPPSPAKSRAAAGYKPPQGTSSSGFLLLIVLVVIVLVVLGTEEACRKSVNN